MADTMNMDMIFRANASQAVKAVGEVKGALEGVSAVAEKAEKATGRARDATGRFVAAGKATEDGFTGAKRGVDAFGGSTEKVGSSAGSSGLALKNFAMQLSQVGQQGAVTGNYLGALAIQLPDMLMGFGAVGALIGTAAAVLSPFAIELLSAGDAADKGATGIDGLGNAVSRLADVSQARSVDIETHLSRAFGNVSGKVQALIDDLRAAEFAVISNEMRRNIEDATSGLTRLSGAFEIWTQEFLNPGSVDSGYLREVEDVIAASKMSLDQFGQLEAAVKKVYAADNVDDFVAALAEARSVALDIGGPVGSAVAKSLLDAAKEGGVLNRVLGDASSSASNLASIDLASGIAAASAEAVLLAQNLGVSLATAQAMMGLKASSGGDRGLGFGGVGPMEDPIYGGVPSIGYGKNPGTGSRDPRFVPSAPAVASPRASGSSGGGGGVSAIEKQAAAMERLLRQEQLELDLARETDPVQRAMIRNREALTGATAEKRAEYEATVTQRLQVEALNQSWEFLGQTAFDALGQMIVQGKDASDVIANLAASLASAALQSAFLGTGPLAGVFGTATSGGLFGSLFGVKAHAEGGPIAGPGTGTSDSILMWGSNGEYMINAASAALYRPVLDQINADKGGALLRSLPRYASGGPIGTTARSSGWTSSGGGAVPRVVVALELSGDLDARIRDTSSEVAVETVRSGLSQYDRQVLPSRVTAIQADPRRRS